MDKQQTPPEKPKQTQHKHKRARGSQPKPKSTAPELPLSKNDTSKVDATTSPDGGKKRKHAPTAIPPPSAGDVTNEDPVRDADHPDYVSRDARHVLEGYHIKDRYMYPIATLAVNLCKAAVEMLSSTPDEKGPMLTKLLRMIDSGLIWEEITMKEQTLDRSGQAIADRDNKLLGKGLDLLAKDQEIEKLKAEVKKWKEAASTGQGSA